MKRNTRNDPTGILICLWGVPVLWKCLRQGCITRSTPHSETIAICDAIQLSQTVGFLDHLGELPCQKPNYAATPVTLVDCLPAVRQAQAPDALKGTRHYHISHHFAREFGDLIAQIPTALMRADGLTKPLDRQGHKAILETVPERANTTKLGKAEEADHDEN